MTITSNIFIPAAGMPQTPGQGVQSGMPSSTSLEFINLIANPLPLQPNTQQTQTDTPPSLLLQNSINTSTSQVQGEIQEIFLPTPLLNTSPQIQEGFKVNKPETPQEITTDPILQLIQLSQAQGTEKASPLQTATAISKPKSDVPLLNPDTILSSSLSQETPIFIETGPFPPANTPILCKAMKIPHIRGHFDEDPKPEITSLTTNPPYAIYGLSDQKIILSFLENIQHQNADAPEEEIVQFLTEHGADAETIQKYLHELKNMTARNNVSEPPSQLSEQDQISASLKDFKPHQDKSLDKNDSSSLSLSKPSKEPLLSGNTPSTFSNTETGIVSPRSHRKEDMSFNKDDTSLLNKFKISDLPVIEQRLSSPNSPDFSKNLIAEIPTTTPVSPRDPVQINQIPANPSPTPLIQTVSVQLKSNAQSKIEMMTLELHPADLGRLDIKMKFSRTGTMKAYLSAERPETLALLRQDASHLQRALQDSGFETDENTLNFDLRQNHHGQQSFHQEQGYEGRSYQTPQQRYREASSSFMPLQQAHIPVYANGMIATSGVNIMV